MPADTALFVEKSNTMVEPGLLHNVHFDGLAKGTYFVYVVSGTLKADATFILTDSSKLSEELLSILNRSWYNTIQSQIVYLTFLAPLF